MKYGYVDDMTVRCSWQGTVVSVDFVIDNSVLYEFMDCLKPVNEKAKREPIAAILDYSAQEVNDGQD